MTCACSMTTLSEDRTKDCGIVDLWFFDENRNGSKREYENIPDVLPLCCL